ncbi:MAG: hypothetical protein A2176_15440 [Spirochaetes bacterium RBG_13_51_14]|nr:MAG: hypothetical protein A2176_15440 [Spirochaetes bacterium RBG_13_51_14]
MNKPIKPFRPPCGDCGGRCCQYTAIEIDRPVSKTAYDNIRWYLCHTDVHVFVDHDRKWHVEFRSRCENLAVDHTCRIYDDRPQLCRNHGNAEDECEYYDSPYLHYFSSREEFEHYLCSKGVDWRFKQPGK